ncbi:MAG: hypothetical protein IJP92_05390 [Lachnospiraceae bacterium]|nr:hypothetical protein [Lachnospiraceae bacterium]
MKNRKQQLTRLFFVFLTAATLWYLNEVLCVKSDHGIDQGRAMYYQPRNSIDVVMMGSSHIHCDIDPGILWHDYGIAAFDYSAAAQPLWNTYHYLVEFCKYQNPKVVVLDLFSPAIDKEDYQYTWLRQNLYGVRFSLNKLQMLFASAEPDKIEDYFPAFFYHHNRFGELSAGDFLYPFTKGEELRAFKGFTPYFQRNPQERPNLTETERGSLTTKSEYYLNRIIEFAEEKGIELFLVVTPYITVEQDELVYNRIREIAAQHGLQFQSTNYYYDAMGLDFETDFHDDSHLNYWGAVKFTHYLAKELKARYDLPDRRGDARYESWEENYRATATYVEENTGTTDNGTPGTGDP